LEFDVTEPEYISRYADNLLKLAACGMRIPLDWVHKKMQIPQAEPDEPQLVAPTSASKSPADKGEG
jgi:phage gp29-like protein